MSYSNSFPQQRPTLNLVFNGGSDQLDSRISFSRADSTPSAVHYWSNEKHLSSENLVPYSNLNSGFSFARTTKASTNNSAPDGGSDAVSILETAVSGGHEVYDTFNSVSGQQYSFVVYLKANGRTKVIFKPQATSTIANVTFDLTAVTSTVTSGSADSHSITAIGSTGWYKCVATVTATATGTGYTQINLVDGAGASTYTGDVTKGVYAWGASVSSTGQTVVNQTSGSIHREYSSTLKSVANSGDPRFEYSPADGQSVGTPKGLLVEAQATNLQRYGSAFASWNNFPNITVTSNAAVAPNGLLEADLVVASSTPTSTYVYDNSTSIVSGTTYTASVYVKDAGQRYVQLLGGSGSFHSDRFATYDLQTGSVDTNGVTASAVSVGNGWWRIEMSILATGTSSAGIAITFVDSATSSYLPTFTGNDFDGLLIWGFQLETGSSTSSLVDTGTSSSSATRAADSCSVAVSDFAGFADTEGSVIVEATVNSLDSGNAAAVSLANAAGTEYIKTGYEIGGATDQSVRTYVRSNSLDQAWLDAGSVSTTGSYKVGVRYEKNNVGISLNGASAVTDTVATMPIGMTTLYIGSGNSSGGNPLNANLKRITYYSEPLSDTNLTALTS